MCWRVGANSLQLTKPLHAALRPMQQRGTNAPRCQRPAVVNAPIDRSIRAACCLIAQRHGD
eukprot:scaffold284811_cov37-Tisochrysis_lutea.AAC.1